MRRKIGSLRQLDQNVGLRVAEAGCAALFLGDGCIELQHPASSLLEFRPQRFESGDDCPVSAPRDLRGSQARKGRRDLPLAPLDEVIQRIAHLFRGSDHARRSRLSLRRPPRCSSRGLLDERALAHQHIIKIHPVRGAGDADPTPLAAFQRKAHSRAAASPAVSASARTITSPPLQAADGGCEVRWRKAPAHAGRPLSCIAARQVSRPSPTIRVSPAGARRTEPPPQRPEHHLLRFPHRSFCPAVLREVGAMDGDRRVALAPLSPSQSSPATNCQTDASGRG